jgi:hypothetical protein
MSYRDIYVDKGSTAARWLGLATLMTLCLAVPRIVLAADPVANSSDHIIWDEPPGGGAAPAPAAPTSSAPIRDNFAAEAKLGPPPMAPARPGQAGPCREFQQRIMIEGRQQLAHGTACRQPDGSWRITN